MANLRSGLAVIVLLAIAVSLFELYHAVIHVHHHMTLETWKDGAVIFLALSAIPFAVVEIWRRANRMREPDFGRALLVEFSYIALMVAVILLVTYFWTQNLQFILAAWGSFWIGSAAWATENERQCEERLNAVPPTQSNLFAWRASRTMRNR